MRPTRSAPSLLRLGLVLVLGAAPAAFAVVTQNLAAAGSGTGASVNDQNGATQYDAPPAALYASVVWAAEQTFNKLIMEQCPGWVVAGFDVQVAKSGVASPNPASDADWETVPGGSFSGMASGGPSTFGFAFATPYTRTGARLRGTNASNIADGAMRVRELWAFNDYANLAGHATITAPGWGVHGTGTSVADVLTNENFVTGQAYNPVLANGRTITFEWGVPQSIAAVLIHGGTGAANERLIDYALEVSGDGSAWSPVATYTGNTAKTVETIFGTPLSTRYLRLFISNADGGTDARVGEIMIFPVIPEPAAVALLACGCCVLPRRRR